jgi:hypothetical protein
MPVMTTASVPCTARRGAGNEALSARPVLLGLLLVTLAMGLCCSASALESRDAPAPDAACDPSGVCLLQGADAGPPEGAALATPAELTLFWATGCPHCEAAKQFLAGLKRDRPELHVEFVEVRQDTAGRQRFLHTLSRLGATASGVPTFVAANRYVIGFTRGVTEAQILELVDASSQPPGVPSGIPEGRGPTDVVQTRWFGRLSASELGLPLFTLALGLLDGFNPCAMWVLVFLLAMLAGQRDRARMALTAGTFVVVSGVVYFVFMAAWLSVFLVVGMTRVVQVVLGGVALAVGGVNVKDFLALGRGMSLSIPDSAKPGIYARVREILRAHTLAGSVLGVAVLAVLVNFVELLCTAGLPAIYTAVLAQRELSTWGRLAYLGLYNLAYIADDAAMVTIAVVTLSRRRLAESAGRWLKLVSGAVMLALGLLLIFRPDWLP